MMRQIVKVKSHAFAAAAFVAIAAFTAPREADIVNLRLGQKVYVDDGICPSGQVMLVTGAKLGAAGVQRTKQCVDRKGIKR